MRIALYARVSTSDQKCELQLAELRQYVSARSWNVVGEYVDAGWSGAKINRPQLQKLMNDARKRKLDAVIVWKLDRFGRSLADLIANIQELTGLGIRFVAITQGIDTDQNNAMSRFFTHILGAFAELERELIRERVVAGMKVARTNGKHVGRPRRIFRRDEAVRLRDKGLSWRAIADKLGVPLTTVVRSCTERVPAADAVVR